jgi:predicted amidohydrolase YtcJ
MQNHKYQLVNTTIYKKPESEVMKKLLIKNGIVVTMDKIQRIIEDGAVGIENGKIVAVGKTTDVEGGFRGARIIDAANQAVLPGLINLHYHSHLFTQGLFQSETPMATLDELPVQVLLSACQEDDCGRYLR